MLTVGLLGLVFALANRNQQVFVTESGVVGYEPERPHYN